MSAPDVGAKIRQLRTVTGLGQVEFAKRVGIANGSVSKIENGRMDVSDELISSAASVLGCTTDFLTNGSHPVLASKPWLRAYADASKRLVDQQMADLALSIELIEVLQLKAIPDTIPVFDGDLSNDDEIEQHALDVRAAAHLEDADIVGNMIRAAERLGCVVLPMREELGRHLGLSTRANSVPVICVSRPSHDPDRHVPGDRQRFTVAHELGHLALHSGLGPPQTGEDASRLEKQAHRFAGALLAPGDAMLEALKDLGGRVTLRTLSRIKQDWGVAIKALVMRFQALGVIDPDQARSLYKQISARGWTKQEPVPVGNEQAIWFAKAIARWAGGDPESIKAAALASGLGQRHLQRWIDWGPSGDPRRNGDLVDITGRARRASPRGQSDRATVTALPVRGD